MGVTKDDIKREKQQMLKWWKRQFSADVTRCWLTNPAGPLKRIGTVPSTNFDSQLRQLHDKWGYCAKGTVKTGGLCVGTIYRTEEFIKISAAARSGTRKSRGGNVHVEHTVPINSLSTEIAKISERLRNDYAFLLPWLLKHSVTCAFERGQENFSKGYTKKTYAFRQSIKPEEINLPFARYNHLSNGPVHVWDIWNEQLVDIDSFTFNDHMANVDNILQAVGAPLNLQEAIRANQGLGA